MPFYAPAGGGSAGLTHEGSQLTEASSNVAAQSDLISVTSLDIAATKPILVLVSIRKTTGTDGVSSFGLTLNSNNIVYAGSGSLNAFGALGSAAAEGSSLIAYIPPRTANYLRALEMEGGTRNRGAVSTLPNYNADAPTANITTITVTAFSTNTDTTLYADDMHVYTVATE